MTETELLGLLSERKAMLPAHVAVIMDGNGRWARKRLLPHIMGHRAGVKTVRMVVETAGTLNIKYLTLYAFSTENWSRPQEEVNSLMNLLREYLRKEVDSLKRNNVRLQAIGRIHELPISCQEELARAREVTASCTGLNLVLALNYSGRMELLDAVEKAVTQVRKGPISEAKFRSFFYLPELPDVDLLIRTSGESRVSNFLLWQCSYAEFHIAARLWPEFRKIDFLKAVADFTNRERRFGGTG
ncbi:MAG: isoprenyl transferase [Candidatus Wallbacteria bacterium]|nr:isoprenyl transferase [Candidatus Wallbacteria bacterium]